MLTYLAKKIKMKMVYKIENNDTMLAGLFKIKHFKSYLRLVPVPGKCICSTGILGCHWLYQVVSLVAIPVQLL